MPKPILLKPAEIQGEAWLIKDTVKFDVPELQNDKNDKSKPNLLKFQKKPSHTK